MGRRDTTPAGGGGARGSSSALLPRLLLACCSLALLLLLVATLPAPAAGQHAAAKARADAMASSKPRRLSGAGAVEIGVDGVLRRLQEEDVEEEEDEDIEEDDEEEEDEDDEEVSVVGVGILDPGGGRSGLDAAAGVG